MLTKRHGRSEDAGMSALPMELHLRMLEETLRKRRSANRRYSLRAFARDLGMEPSTLSRILKRQRNIPVDTLERIASRLGLEGEEAAAFCSSALRTRGVLLKTSVAPVDRHALRADRHFRIITDWEYFAFLNLMKLKGFDPAPSSVAARLGISQARATAVIRDLIEHGMIRRERDGSFTRLHPKLTTSDEQASLALRIAHGQEMRLASEKLHRVPVELRDFCSYTVTAEPAKLKAAKRLTREYLEAMGRLLETAKATEVYQICVQVFPMTEPAARAGKGKKAR